MKWLPHIPQCTAVWVRSVIVYLKISLTIIHSRSIFQYFTRTSQVQKLTNLATVGFEDRYNVMSVLCLDQQHNYECDTAVYISTMNKKLILINLHFRHSVVSYFILLRLKKACSRLKFHISEQHALVVVSLIWMNQLNEWFNGTNKLLVLFLNEFVI